MSFVGPMSSLLIPDAPIEHQSQVYVRTGHLFFTRSGLVPVNPCAGHLWFAARNGLGEGDRDEPNQFTWRRVELSWTINRELFQKNLQKKWRAALDRLLILAIPKENYCPHCSPKPSVSRRILAFYTINRERYEEYVQKRWSAPKLLHRPKSICKPSEPENYCLHSSVRALKASVSWRRIASSTINRELFKENLLKISSDHIKRVPTLNFTKWIRKSMCIASEPKKYCFYCSVRALKASLRDFLYAMMSLATGMEIFRDNTSAHADLHSSLGRYSINHLDLKIENILLDEKVVAKISDFEMSRLNDYTQIPMGSAVPTHNRPLDAKFSGIPSAKHGIEIKICSPMTHLGRYLSVHHHPLIQMLPPARKWLDDILTSCVRLITLKKSFSIAEAGWISAKPKYETPNAGRISGYMIRKYFNIRKWLTVNESQQHSDPDSCRSGHNKIAVNTMTSASWIIATAAPHHATGNRNLLSGFIMEHDDQFVHAVNRVPMKVLARGAVVTDAFILPDVWFVPGLTENLVSVSQLAELDHSIGFGRGECCIRSARDAKIVGKGRLQKGGHYVLDYLKVPLAM